MMCPKCNHAVSDGERFCGNCGQPIDSSSTNPPAAVIPPAAASPSAAAASPAAASAASAARTDAATPLPGLLQRIKNIVLTPKTEWPVIETEATSVQQLFLGYAAPLAAFSALMMFIRMSIMGIGMPFGGATRIPLLNGLLMGVERFGFGLLGLFLAGLIINALAPTFAGERNLRQALKTAAYAFTPAWLASVFALLGMLAGLLQIVAAVYAIYLLFLGLPVLMKSTRDKATGYTVAVVVCTILLGVALSALIGLTGGLGGYGRVGGM